MCLLRAFFSVSGFCHACTYFIIFAFTYAHISSHSVLANAGVQLVSIHACSMQAYRLAHSIKLALEKTGQQARSIGSEDGDRHSPPPQALVFIWLPRSSDQVVASMACILCRCGCCNFCICLWGECAVHSFPCVDTLVLGLREEMGSSH
jgi:hypothetical protein